MIVVLAGGAGGTAKFLRGLVKAMPPQDLTVIVNTADDIELLGLYVSPDVDSIMYTLAGASDPVRGWGLANETWNALRGLERYGAPTWFQLGDSDLATHLQRTRRMAQGATLTQVTAELSHAWGVKSTVLPMSDDRVTTRIVVEEAGTGRGLDLHVQEYLVKRGAQDPVRDIRFEGIEHAKPAPGVLAAIAEASAVIVGPSNPVVSIGPILAVDGVRSALRNFNGKIIGISPLIRGAAVKGPAAQLMPAAGMEVSCVGVADAYRDFLHTLVIDFADVERSPEIAALEVDPVPAQTLMGGVPQATVLARTVLRLIER
jgi:LPPG:FO 2-phospho-L-lactate transferase